MEPPAEEEGGGRGAPRHGPVPEAPTPSAPGVAPVEAPPWPAGASGSGGDGQARKRLSPGGGAPAAAGGPQLGAAIDKQQLLQQLLTVAAAEEGAQGRVAAGLPPLQPPQLGVPSPAAPALPPFWAQPAVPFAAQSFGAPAPPTAAPKLTLAQLQQAQLAANHVQREATPDQLEAAAGEEMVEAGQQQWEEEEMEEEGEGEGEGEGEAEEGGSMAARRAARRERNRQAAARYRQRQKEQRGQVEAQLEAAQAQRAQLLAEREQLTFDHLALARMEAVQRDLHHSILQLCHPEGSIMAAALAAAASGASSGTSSSSGKPPAFPRGEAARLVEQAERQFAEELRQVVDAGDNEAQAAAALRLLPATHRAALEASPAVFTQQCSELQKDIHQLLLPPPPGQQAQHAQQAQHGQDGDAAFPVRLDAMHTCAVLRKLLVAMALAAPSPTKLLHLVAASAAAPPGIWRDAVDVLRPTLCPQQLEQLRHAWRQWVGDVGRVLVARNYQLSRPNLRSWQTAAAAMQPGGTGGGGSAEQAASPASAAAAAGQAAAGGHGTAEAAAPLDYGGMAVAAVQREQTLRELRGLDDTSQRAFGCLIALIIATLQVMTLWQCTMLLATCYPHFPDPAAILAQVLDSDEGPPQQAQQVQLEELPAAPDDVAG